MLVSPDEVGSAGGGGGEGLANRRPVGTLGEQRLQQETRLVRAEVPGLLISPHGSPSPDGPVTSAAAHRRRGERNEPKKGAFYPKLAHGGWKWIIN